MRNEAQQTLCEQFGSEEPTITIPSFISIDPENPSPPTSVNTSDLNVSGYSNQNIFITVNLIVNTNFTLNNCHIKMAPGTSITIQSTKTFTVNNCKIYACLKRWQGIVVQVNTAYLNMISTSIEDAEIAVEGYNNCIIDIKDDTFNRNVIGLANHVDNPQTGQNHSFVLTASHNTFDCSSRLNPPAAFPINSSTSPAWGRAGMKFVRGNQTIGSGQITGTQNTFQNLNFGIESIESFITVEYCIFKNQRTSGINHTSGGKVTKPAAVANAGNGVFGTGKGNTKCTPVNNGNLFQLNQAQGILVEKGMALECLRATFTDNRRYGIRVQNNAFPTAIRIENNTFNNNDIGTGGVYIQRSSGQGSSINNIIRDNAFNLNSIQAVERNAIFISGINNGKDIMEVDHNTIIIDGTYLITGIYYSPVAGTDFNRIINNPISVPQHVCGWGIGIIGGTTAGLHNIVQNNTITTHTDPSTSDEYTDYAMICGIHGQGTGNFTYCNNTVNGCEHGFHGFLNIPNSDLLLNHFNPNGFGIKLEDGAPVGNNSCHANVFTLNNGDYFSGALVVNGNDAINSPFLTRLNVANQIPPKQSPNNWFVGDPSCVTDPNACPIFNPSSPRTPSIDSLDRSIAAGTYPSNIPAAIVEMRLQLYHRLKNHPNIYTNEPVVAEFMNDMSTSHAALLSQADDMYSAAANYPSTLTVDLGLYETQLNALLGSIYQVDSLLSLPNGITQTLTDQRLILVNQFDSILVSYSALYTQYSIQKAIALNQTMSLLNTVTTNSNIEDFAKKARIYACKQALGIELTQADVDTLLMIATACPEEVGHSVSYAQALLPDSISYVSLINDTHCNNQGQYIDWNERKDNSQLVVTVSPNPTNGVLNITSNNLINTIRIYNSTGQLVVEKRGIASDKVITKMDMKGIFIMTVTDVNGIMSSQKIIIQ